jgi:hypothetical protein
MRAGDPPFSTGVPEAKGFPRGRRAALLVDEQRPVGTLPDQELVLLDLMF